MDKSAKENVPRTPPATAPAASQEQSTTSAGMINPEWSGFQAYSPMPPHGYVASSPQAHPYMWGVQHMMPPYGTPPHPYVAMYPPGGIYAHPSMPPGSYPFSPYAMPSPNGIAEASGNTPGSIEGEGKPSDAKEKLPIKRSKGSLGSLNVITGKNNEPGKSSGASANGAYSKSGDSASDGTSEGSGANSENESDNGSGQDPHEASQNGGSSARNGSKNARTLKNQTMAIMPMPTSGTPAGIPGPTTNLNIGMDYWGAPTSPAMPAVHGKVPRDGTQSQPWLQDERELKRQRRKQSNRESARRSRLRKQAECDELAQRAEALKEENSTLRAEVDRIKCEYEQLLSENASLKERLGESPVPAPEDIITSEKEDQNLNKDDAQTETVTVQDGGN